MAKEGDANSWGPDTYEKASPSPKDGARNTHAQITESALPTTKTKQHSTNYELTMPPVTTPDSIGTSSGHDTPPRDVIMSRIYGPVMPHPGQPGALHFDNMN